LRLDESKGFTPITKTSIENVKCTRIISGENSEKYNKYLQYLAKEVLKYSVTRNDGHKHDEIVIAARIDGRYTSQPIAGYWDGANASTIKLSRNIEFQFMLDENDKNSLVLVHNHPSNTPVSIHDIMVLLGSEQILTVLAVGNNGEVKYAIKTSNNSIIYDQLLNKIYVNLNKGKYTLDQIYDIIIEKQDKYNLKIR
jgi:hypothetical protein